MSVREVFVFGSNLAGRHGKGAALYAAKQYGAIRGVGEGFSGDSYAIPTKCANLKTLPIGSVALAIKTFCDVAREAPDVRFLVTPVGTGLAGHRKAAIWRAFVDARMPANCVLTSSWMIPEEG